MNMFLLVVQHKMHLPRSPGSHDSSRQRDTGLLLLPSNDLPDSVMYRGGD